MPYAGTETSDIRQFLTVILAFAPTDGAALTSATVCNVLVADILRRYSMQVRSVRWSRPQSIAHIEELVHPLPPGWSAEVNGCGRPYFIKCVRAYVCACVCVSLRACKCACVRTCVCACMCACVRTCVRAQVCINVYMCAMQIMHLVLILETGC